MTITKRMEFFVSMLLRAGVVICGLMMVIGLVMLWFTNDTSNPTGILTLEWIFRGNTFLEPSHLLFIGFLILIITPILRIITTVLVNVWLKDWAFTAITGTVLIIIIVSMTFGIG